RTTPSAVCVGTQPARALLPPEVIPSIDPFCVRKEDAMAASNKPHATGKTKPGDVSQRVGVESITARGVNVEQLLQKLIAAAGAEFTTYYYYTILRMHLAGHEDYKEICEDARLEDRAHFELITPRIYELGGSIPKDIRTFADRAGCPDAYLPGSEDGKRRISNPRAI